MSRKSQIFSLTKQELRIFTRSKAFIVVILILPIALWSYQVVMYRIDHHSTSGKFNGDTIYITNQDTGNSTIIMGEIFIDAFQSLISNPESELHGAKLQFINQTIPDPVSYIRDSRNSPLIWIPSNFTSLFTQSGESNDIAAIIDLFVLPNDNEIGNSINYHIYTVLGNQPFTVGKFDKLTYIEPIYISYEGEEGASNFGLIFQLVAFTIYITAFVPSAYVTGTTAGEREKQTLESILALPIRRFDILLAKCLGGIGIISIFSVLNLVGMSVYAWIIKNGKFGIIAVDPHIGATQILIMFLTTILTGTMAMGFGIALTSRMTEKRSADSTYSLVIAVPIMLVAVVFLFSDGSGPWWLYLIPWTHALALMMKGLYPKTFGETTITGAIWTDIIFHTVVILVFVIIALVVAANLFSREKIVISGGKSK